MNTPFIWILVPAILSGLLLIFQRYERIVAILGTLSGIVFAGLAWWLPVREQFIIGPWTLRIVDTWTVLGRSFVLGGNDRPVLVILYLTAAIWCGAAYVARPRRTFVPLALMMIALLTAAISVEPFLYAALLIEMAILTSIPFLVSDGRVIGRGVYRYLTFQTLGMPFILFSGWMLTDVGTSAGEQEFVRQAAVLIGLGFAILMAIFPFHSWIPMLAEESHPYAVAFVLLLLPGAISFFGLGFLDRYPGLSSAETTYSFLRLGGILMVVIGGVWAAFQRHLGRMLGFAAIVEIGLSLVALSLGGPAQQTRSLQIFFAGLLPRGLGFGVWGLALTAIQARTTGLLYREVQGAARRAPIAAAALVIAHFSLAGLPLLAAFPVRIALWEELASIYPSSVSWLLIGNVGLLIGGLRTLAVLVMGPDEQDWQLTESWSEQVYLLLGILALFLVGLFPQWFFPFFTNMPQVFERLFP